MMASHDFSKGNFMSSVKRLEYIINKQPEYHSTTFIYSGSDKIKFKI